MVFSYISTSKYVTMQYPVSQADIWIDITKKLALKFYSYDYYVSVKRK